MSNVDRAKLEERKPTHAGRSRGFLHKERVAANADLKTDDTAGAQGNEDVDLLGKAWSQSARVVLSIYGEQKEKRSTRRRSWRRKVTDLARAAHSRAY